MRRDVLLHVFSTCITKHLRGPWCVRPPPRHSHHLPRRPTRILPIFIERLQTPRKHFLKTHSVWRVRSQQLFFGTKIQVVRQLQGCKRNPLLPILVLQLEMRCVTGKICSERYVHHHTIRHSMTNHIPRHVQPCRACGAVVVDIVDGNLRHAELVEDALTAGRVAVTVAGNALVHIVVVDLSIEEGFDAGFEAEFGVVDCTDSEAEGREGSRLPLPRGLMNLVRPTPRT